MTQFAHRGFLVNATIATEKGVIETQFGKAIHYKSDVILTDKNGNIVITTETIFKKDYVPVEEVVEKESIKNAYAEALQGFSLDSSLEDEEYMSDFQSKVRERNGNTY